MASIAKIVEKGCRYVYLHGWLYHVIGRRHRRRVAMVKQRGKARVVILAMSVAMWKYQHLYEALSGDSRFEVTIVISPSIDYDHEQRTRDVCALRQYFDARQMPYVDFDLSEDSAPLDISQQIDPDIIFYPQPYEHLLVDEHDCINHYDRLLCYYPYAFMTGRGKFSYDFHFHNLAWRLYYANQEIKHEAEMTAANHGRNVRIVGHPNGDDFATWSGNDPWRVMSDGRRRKRIIWAPHFSFNDKFGQLPRANFLWMAHFMLDVAQRYKEFIQIAFKPHPRLLTELYAHHEWGRTRTDDYYKMWSEMENTQLETGGYVDLMMSSDAMIHDSGSFVIEYFYTHKPVMFVSRDINHFLTGQSSFSREAFAQLYIGKDEREILDFIDQVVLGEDDPMLPKRMDFYRRHLLAPNGKTVSENTVDDLVKSLGLDDNGR